MSLSGDVIKGPEYDIEGEDDGNNGTLWYGISNSVTKSESIPCVVSAPMGGNFVNKVAEVITTANSYLTTGSKKIVETVGKVPSELLGTVKCYIETVTKVPSELLGTVEYYIETVTKVPSESITVPTYQTETITLTNAQSSNTAGDQFIKDALTLPNSESMNTAGDQFKADDSTGSGAGTLKITQSVTITNT